MSKKMIAGIALWAFSVLVSCSSNVKQHEFDVVKFRRIDTGTMDSAKINPPEARIKIDSGRPIQPIQTSIFGLVASVVFDGKDHRNDPEISSTLGGIIEKQKIDAIAVEKR